MAIQNELFDAYVNQFLTARTDEELPKRPAGGATAGNQLVYDRALRRAAEQMVGGDVNSPSYKQYAMMYGALDRKGKIAVWDATSGSYRAGIPALDVDGNGKLERDWGSNDSDSFHVKNTAEASSYLDARSVAVAVSNVMHKLRDREIPTAKDKLIDQGAVRKEYARKHYKNEAHLEVEMVKDTAAAVEYGDAATTISQAVRPEFGGQKYAALPTVDSYLATQQIAALTPKSTPKAPVTQLAKAAPAAAAPKADQKVEPKAKDTETAPAPTEVAHVDAPKEKHRRAVKPAADEPNVPIDPAFQVAMQYAGLSTGRGNNARFDMNASYEENLKAMDGVKGKVTRGSLIEYKKAHPLLANATDEQLLASIVEEASKVRTALAAKATETKATETKAGQKAPDVAGAAIAAVATVPTSTLQDVITPKEIVTLVNPFKDVKLVDSTANLHIQTVDVLSQARDAAKVASSSVTGGEGAKEAPAPTGGPGKKPVDPFAAKPITI